MSDIKNIRIGDKTPDKIYRCINGEPVEIKRIYKIIGNSPVVVWDVGGRDYADITAVFDVTANTKFTFPALTILAKNGKIDWGDETKESYVSNASISHVYSRPARVAIALSCDGITDLISNAFSGRNDLISFSAENVASIGDGIFNNCINLEKVAFAAGLTRIPRIAFYMCNSLTHYVKTATYISEFAYMYAGLTGEIEIKDNSVVEGQAFSNNYDLQKVKIGRSVSLIQCSHPIDKYSHFSNCYGVEEYDISCKVIPEKFAANNITDTQKLQTLKFNEGVEQIGIIKGQYCFSVGVAAASPHVDDVYIYLPHSLKILGSAFRTEGNSTYHGNHVLHIHYNGTAEDWGEIDMNRTGGGTTFWGGTGASAKLYTSDGNIYNVDRNGSLKEIF